MLRKTLKTTRDDLDAVKNELARNTEQLKRLDGSREGLRALRAESEELERTIIERRRSLELVLRPALPSELSTDAVACAGSVARHGPLKIGQ